MIRRLNAVIFTGCLLFATQIAKAAETPLTLFPSDTGVIVKLASPNKVTKNLADAVNLVQPGFGAMVQGQATSIGVGISNPTLQGVDMEKNWWMGVFLAEEEEPQVVFVIPATDISDMEDAIDESFTFVKKDNWGIYSEDEEAVKRIQNVISGSSKSIEATLAGKLATTFDSGDLSVFVNSPVMVSLYSEKISQALEDAKSEIANMDENPSMSGVTQEVLKEQLPVLFDKLVAALKDNVGMVLTLNANPKGLQLNKVAVQKPSSESAKFLSGVSSANIDDLLKGLPANQPIYVASSVDFTQLAVKFYDLLGDSKSIDEDVKTSLANLKKTFQSTTSKGFAAAVGLGSFNDGIIRSYGVQLVTPSTTMKSVMKDTQNVMGVFSGGELTQEITYEENKETVSGQPVDIMEIEQEYGGDPQVRQMTEQIMSVMYGPDGLTTRMMYLNEGILQSMGGGTAGMEETYRAWQAKENLKSGSALARDRAALQSKLSFVEMLDFVSLAAKGAIIAAESGQVPIPITPEQIESIDILPSYVGIAVTVDGNTVEGRLHIPIEQFQNGAKLATAIMQMMQPEAN